MTDRDKRTKIRHKLEAVQTQACSARTITDSLLEHIAGIAQSCGAAAIFVYVDALDGKPISLPENLKQKVYYVTKTIEEDRPLTRLGQVKIAVFLALSRGLVKHGDTIVFLSGIAASGSLDTIIVTEVGREYEMYASVDTDHAPLSHILPEIVERVINLASELGKEGREGKPVGALFVVGDTDKVLPLTRQLILNPFRGYPEEQRNILDESLEETVKELSALDGAFIIRGDGIIETCGAYLKTASQDEFDLPRGLGARHHAAAAITSVTDSIAVTISESTGTVTIFQAGRIMTEIEKPRTIGRKPVPSAVSDKGPSHTQSKSGPGKISKES